ncbi:class I SAM-dependent methyltransferase [Streptomyces neyagawaensis]|uniref:class I SAM-dependent methyltransferase n=1 Tax=Streptomyces neyagawaensis TaxID=42238 RepID=UPI000A3E38DD|nr:class I SAM-dependent methyltransferase [Streptomyces neyagawaensis]MCL6733474.1 class I SAM-dependent methyltransferase [Streptomyces neyagawaensis]MDE1685287.1 class I SAM-dependent methyltransferase [Streptomyces neyagawaensis]
MTIAAGKPSMGELQEREHGVGHDYAKGSPHIRHHTVRDRLIGDLHALVHEVIDRNGQCRVVELGAGHGTFTDHLLAAGAQITVTEMSEPSAHLLRHRFQHNPNVTVIHDKDGTAACTAGPFDAVVCISVLHHIPDYLTTVKQLVENTVPGGAFFSAQDPLWYPRRSPLSLGLDRGAYFLWRLGQGHLRRGIATRLRRIRGVYDDMNEADMVEYHVVRNGVDEEALQGLLAPAFAKLEVQRYWSTQSGFMQAVGERVCPPSTFSLVARERRSA